MIGEIRQNFTEASASVGLILATALRGKRGGGGCVSESDAYSEPDHQLDFFLLSYSTVSCRSVTYNLGVPSFPTSASEREDYFLAKEVPVCG